MVITVPFISGTEWLIYTLSVLAVVRVIRYLIQFLPFF